MKLADFLHTNRLTTGQLRRALGVRSRSTITRYLHGDRTPSPLTMQRIIEFTQGQVQLRDFLSPGNPECATVIVGRDGRKRLVFPWTTRGHDRHAAELVANQALESELAADAVAPAVVRQAARELEHRVRRGGSQWFLDGRPSDARRIVQAANERRSRRGESHLHYPGIIHARKLCG